MRSHSLSGSGCVLCLATTLLSGATLYDSIPDPLPPNVVSMPYQAAATREFGNAVTLAPGDRRLTRFTVLMSVWALHSTYPDLSDEGFEVPITLNFYEYGTAGEVGPRFAQTTLNAFLPWRPEASPGCGAAWRAGDGLCYNGLAVPVEFDFRSRNVILPETFIFGIAFNTQSYGANPVGQPGPYNSLNVGVAGSPRIGADTTPGTVYLDSLWAGAYGDGGPTGVFRATPGWDGYTVDVRIETTPEPSAFLLSGSVLLLAVAGRFVRPRRGPRPSPARDT